MLLVRISLVIFEEFFLQQYFYSFPNKSCKNNFKKSTTIIDKYLSFQCPVRTHNISRGAKNYSMWMTGFLRVAKNLQRNRKFFFIIFSHERISKCLSELWSLWLMKSTVRYVKQNTFFLKKLLISTWYFLDIGLSRSGPGWASRFKLNVNVL